MTGSMDDVPSPFVVRIEYSVVSPGIRFCY